MNQMLPSAIAVRIEIGGSLDRGERSDRYAEARDEELLLEPVLRILQRLGAGPHRRDGVRRGCRRERHVLELVGHDVDCRGKRSDLF